MKGRKVTKGQHGKKGKGVALRGVKRTSRVDGSGGVGGERRSGKGTKKGGAGKTPSTRGSHVGQGGKRPAVAARKAAKRK